MSRKDRNFGQLLAYIDRGSSEPGIVYNLRCDDKARILEELQANADLVKQRKNGNYFYHEILSFSPGDSGKLNFAILEDLTRKYLDLRTKGKGLAYAGVHWTENPHIHIMLSSNEFGSSKKFDLSAKAFKSLQRDIETRQKEKYPFLRCSLVFQEPKREKKREMAKTDAEFHRERRLGRQGKQKPTQKEQARKIVENCLEIAFSKEEFDERLKAGGFELYQRGKVWGVRRIETKGKHNSFRLKTLGLAELHDERAVYWEKRPEMEKYMESVELERLNHLTEEMGFRRDVGELLELGEHATDLQKELFRKLQISRKIERERILARELGWL